jgi:hypothetical protein
MPTPARAIEVGLELVATGTLASQVPGEETTFDGYSDSGGFGVGLMVLHRFQLLPALSVDPWVDVQTPISIDAGGGTKSSFVPFDLGLRTGLTLGSWEPFVGVVGQLAFMTQAPVSLNPVIGGLGPNIGLDVAVWLLRVGVDLRAIYTLTPFQSTPTPGFSEHAWELTAILAGRLVLERLWEAER